jgi:hypothetical protein
VRIEEERVLEEIAREERPLPRKKILQGWPKLRDLAQKFD